MILRAMGNGRETIDFLSCDRCGDRIGLYEEMWVKHAGGELIVTGGPDARRLAESGQPFHLGCLTPDRPPTDQPFRR